MSRDDEALDFMTEQEIAEIIEYEELFQIDLSQIDEVFEEVASDSDYE